MKPFLILLTFLLTNISYAQTKYEKDFNEFWKDVNANYAYFDQQKINWSIVKEIYEPHVKEIDKDLIFYLFYLKKYNFTGRVFCKITKYG